MSGKVFSCELHGLARHGREVLTSCHSSTIVEQLSAKDKSFPCAYWYFDGGNAANNRAHSCLRSIAAQLINHADFDSLPESVKSLLSLSSAPNGSPSHTDLEAAIAATAEASTSGVAIALDSVNECPDGNKLIEALRRIRELSGEKARILFTSQPPSHPKVEYDSVSPERLNLQSPEVQSQMDDDMATYVNDIIQSNETLAENKQYIDSALLDNSKQR